MSEFGERVDAARRGDRHGFETLFAASLPRLIAFVRARAGGVVAERESAADLAQSVCREALEDLDGFEFRGEAAFHNWLFARAARKIANRHRHHRRECRDPAREVAAGLEGPLLDDVLTVYSSLASPSRHASAKEEVARIEAALASLPEPQREAIALTRVAGLSYADAAAQLGRSESALRGLVMRGLARLSALLED